MEAEYRSAAFAHHLTLWMIQVGLSPDLILDGLRIVKDELSHAELSHRVFVAAGGMASPPIARESLELRRTKGESLERAITRTCVHTFCLGETVAVPLFKALRDECSVPVARRALDRVLRDEVRHRDFGWSLLEALLELPMASDVRGWVAEDLPVGFAAVRRAYTAEAAAGEALTELGEADRRWGLISPGSYAAIVERTVERDWVPRLRKLGIDAHSAWDRS